MQTSGRRTSTPPSFADAETRGNVKTCSLLVGAASPALVDAENGLVGPGVSVLGLDGSAPGSGPNSAGANSGQGTVPDSGTTGTWVDETDIRPTLLSLAGLHDDYQPDGRVISEVLTQAGAILGTPTVQALGQCYKQLNSSVGNFGPSTLQAPTRALESTSTGDEAYLDTEQALTQLEGARDTLAGQIKHALDATEFDGAQIPNAAELLTACTDVIAQAGGIAKRGRNRGAVLAERGGRRTHHDLYGDCHRSAASTCNPVNINVPGRDERSLLGGRLLERLQRLFSVSFGFGLGEIKGQIYFAGGPAPPNGHRKGPVSGAVSLYLTHLYPGYGSGPVSKTFLPRPGQFTFTAAPGRYLLSASASGKSPIAREPRSLSESGAQRAPTFQSAAASPELGVLVRLQT